ncbi:low affinity immunoglobulin gamma Fc region receptor III-A-like [Crassostrea virginica]|uniref:Down syndrome cell adhesion molecule-like n=1 Tax=Crassostrea virginica TaxID=6565 RepID=A0A8B8E525_CRAVI|nr:Down syndrome cell adhesion molecule-like [Crassostrea virginica]XP_022334451.1 Down syndrome cell adhesion molecule-like [Crassostrea virginica]
MICAVETWKYIYSLILVLNLGVFCRPNYHYTDSPRFLDTGQGYNVTVHRGQKAELACKVENIGPKEVAWVKKPNPFPIAIDTEIFDPEMKNIRINYEKHSSSSQSWNLVIEHAQPSDSGVYECQVTSKIPLSFDIHLQVLDSPLILEPAIELVGVVDNKIVNLYDPLTLTCNSTGSRGPPDAIDWFFEGNLVSNRDPHWKGRIMITKRIQERNPYSLLSDLVISRTEMGDQGRYICRSTTYTDPTTVMPTISAEVMILNTKKTQRRRDDESKPMLKVERLEENAGNRVRSNISYLFLFSVIAALIQLENG